MDDIAQLPEPLVQPNTDLRGLKFMPLDVGRLVDSDFCSLSTGSEFKAAVVLWCKAWNQLPGGSLPAKLSGAGADWKRVRNMALHGFIKCADGRLYHPVIAEKANEAWAMRCLQRQRGARGNAKRWGNQVSCNGDPRGDPCAIARDRDRDTWRLCEEGKVVK
jgi:hypothetical protein